MMLTLVMLMYLVETRKKKHINQHKKTKKNPACAGFFFVFYTISTKRFFPILNFCPFLGTKRGSVILVLVINSDTAPSSTNLLQSLFDFITLASTNESAKLSPVLNLTLSISSGISPF